MRKLIVALACRNNGTRLYGKPNQNLDIENNISILEHLITLLKKQSVIKEIVLGISEEIENDVYEIIARKLNVPFIRGDDGDVLRRLISCGESQDATDILRITSESPFPAVNFFEEAWSKHLSSDSDATFLDNVVDGCGFEILTLASLQKSHDQGSAKHRSELCSLYIRETGLFKIFNIEPPKSWMRKDLRLTVDYPEDLIICRAIYKQFLSDMPNYDIDKIINFLDSRQDLKDLIYDFCEEGYAIMYSTTD
jgi:spore coat polysaccharide biosynthesis protein SpsF